MKILFWIAPVLFILVNCSPKSDTQIGFVNSFSFDIPTDTPPDSLNNVISRAFLKRYALIDTSMVASGKVIDANILAYDSASQQTSCVQGYAIFVSADPKEVLVPGWHGEYFGTPSKIYFFTGSNNHFEVWNDPIVTDGASEDMPEDASINLDYKANSECALLGVSISNPVQVVGVTESEKIAFYYWSGAHHRLKFASDFEIAYSKGGAESVRKYGKIAALYSGNPYGIEYTVSGDENYIAGFTWKNGAYVETSRVEDQSGYVLVLDTMKDVQYPLFKSVKNPKAAQSINKALQMQDFDELVTPESYTRLLKGDDPVSNPDSWEFLVKRINDNVLFVSTVQVKNQIPRRPPFYRQYYFNAHTGDPIHASALINQGSENTFGKKAIAVLKKALEGQENVPCVDYVPNASQPEKVFMTWSLLRDVMTFATPLCDNIEGGPMPEDSHTYYDMVDATAPMSDFDSLRTDYFNDLISQNDVLDPPDGFSRVWHGIIDGKVRVTIILWQAPESGYTGHLLYDAEGTNKPFRATASQDDQITIEELDPDSKSLVATFNVTLTDNKLTGTYKRTDASEKSFAAMPSRGPQ